MKALETKPNIALKNILFATDFEVLANRALPYAIALADHYGSKLYATHVVPPEAYAFAHAAFVQPILKEAEDFATYKLNQIVGLLQHGGRPCEILVSSGEVGNVVTSFARTYCADLIVVGTKSREGIGKLLLGSVAEEIIREAPCPVLTIGPRVATGSWYGIQSIICATDFSPGSWRGIQIAASFAHDHDAHLTLTHVVEGMLRDSPHLAIELTEKRLRDCIPAEPELRYEPEVVVEIGPVSDRILRTAVDLSADLIVMGVRGKRAQAQRASHFGSIAHKVVSLAACPVMTVGDHWQLEDE
jgi:nucleotide-binding universal stress UspA family protein